MFCCYVNLEYPLTTKIWLVMLHGTRTEREIMNLFLYVKKLLEVFYLGVLLKINIYFDFRLDGSTSYLQMSELRLFFKNLPKNRLSIFLKKKFLRNMLYTSCDFC